MCGFVGFYDPKLHSMDKAEECLIAMRDKLHSRGPDDHGVWLDAVAGIALAHRRLSILDLSPAGHQPMLSVNGRYCFAFNGEIYNHMDLRLELSKQSECHWRGTSDTETLLVAIETWGVKKALHACTGMFAFALWDRQEKTLTLARDRLGEKPLYYGWQGGVLLFGSELKALKEHPRFENQIENNVVSLYLRLGYIPAPWSIWRGVNKLEPGCVKVFDIANRGKEKTESYWSFKTVVTDGRNSPFEGSSEEAIEHLKKIMLRGVEQQMTADVPLGAFLSGGVDSSLVVALMQQRLTRPVKTFSIGFHHKAYDEAQHARQVAQHLGTEHVEFYVTAEEARGIIPQLPQIYDEPFGDPSAIPTYLVSRLAKEQVTVALSGDGGDELFGGYNRYHHTRAKQSWDLMQGLPGATKKIPGLLHKVLPSLGIAPIENLKSRLHLLSELAEIQNHYSFYNWMTAQWKQLPTQRNAPDLPYGLDKGFVEGLSSPISKMMAMDTFTYLPDCILPKVDRASMAVSLETRAPMLNHHLVEFAWRLPDSLKVKQGVGKWILRELLYSYVPKAMIERPKKGFGVPVGDWIKGPLRDWAEELLSSRRLAQNGLFDVDSIRRSWDAHLKGQQGLQHPLWLILMFQAWLEQQ